MKKRIISIALIIAMVVAMIPATLIPAFAAQWTGYGNGYDVYFTETDPTLDGQMDAAYANSEMVVDTYHHTNGASFQTYYLATNSGVYVYSNVKDSTVDVAGESAVAQGTGDKAQVYFQLSNTVDGTTEYTWGYYDFDYAHENSAQGPGKAKSSITADGYAIEIFMPWTTWAGSFTQAFSLETIKVYVGFQVNNYSLDGTNNGLVVDNPGTMSYWSSASYGCSGTTAPAKFMISTNVITAPKTTDIKYTSFVTNEAITLDGKRDDIYLASQKITPQKIANGTYGVDAGFETYIVAREDGIYIFASIYDDTLDKAEAVASGLRIQDGDKFQIYLQLGNNRWNRWGYIDFDYLDGGRHLITGTNLGYSVDEVQQKAVIWDDQKGWDIEIFLPHSLSVDNRFNPSKGVVNPSLKDLVCRVNFQALNETCTDWGDDGKATARNRYGLAYDVPQAANAWNGPSANGTYFVPVDFSINPYSQPGTGMFTYAPSVTIDGTKDAAYGDDSLSFVIDRETSDSCASHEHATAKAWVVVTDTKISVYAEIYDETITAGTTTANDNIGLYVYFPLANTASYQGYGYARSGHWSTSSDWKKDAFFSANGTFHDNGYGNSGRTASTKALGNNKYAVEIAVDLPAAERYALAAGNTIEIGIGLLHTDCCGDAGTTTCYTAKTAYNCGAWTTKGCIDKALPRYKVNKNSTATNLVTVTPVISGANVALGESITVNYYATVPAYAELPVMKFTMNGKNTFVHGVATGNANEYKFAFEGIAPQHMGDNISAQLYIAGKNTGAAKATYSVKENVTKVKNDSNKALVEALLHYGAAAQQYTNYKTDALVNAGLTAPTYTTITNTDKVVGAANVNGIKMSAAGVNHSNVNRLYVKASLTTNDPAVLGALVANLKVTIDGKEVAYAETDVPGVYIVYTDGIKVTDFDKVFTIEITDGTNTQTLTYSVNAYCAAKQNAANVETAALAKALYAYGVAAENYVA